MSFWQTSDGETITHETTESTFDGGGGGFEPIPRGTVVISSATEAKWDEYEGEEYISIRWDIVDGDYKGRVNFQKLRVLDSDSKKRDRALKMLATIDKLTGKHLVTLSAKPTDYDLGSICNKPVDLRLEVWEIEIAKERGEVETKSGNWVAAVGAVGALSGSSKPAPQQQATAPTGSKDINDFDDDIPF